jgi:hypothetical protein
MGVAEVREYARKELRFKTSVRNEFRQPPRSDAAARDGYGRLSYG